MSEIYLMAGWMDE